MFSLTILLALVLVLFLKNTAQDWAYSKVTSKKAKVGIFFASVTVTMVMSFIIDALLIELFIAFLVTEIVSYALRKSKGKGKQTPVAA